MIDRKIIEELAAEELVDANTKHDPTFHSHHEAYAVLKEELEEMQDDMKLCTDDLSDLWEYVKYDNEEAIERKLKIMKRRAIHAVQEGIQVIAMCDKALELY